ncbi:MAG: hypothetical protein MUC74_12375 [Ideonella sp.]|jgi:hypothetical protein|nr:hypothetical protein [Ideonella sp.]
MDRRHLLKLGLVSATALSAAGGVALWWSERPPGAPAAMTPAGRGIFRAIARGVLDGVLPEDPGVASVMLDRHLERVEVAIAAFPPHARQELGQLLAVLANPVGRRLLAGLPAAWSEATVTQLQAAFDSMRRSSLTVRRQAFLALRDLTNAAFYSEPGTWAYLDYPGPRLV